MKDNLEKLVEREIEKFDFYKTKGDFEEAFYKFARQVSKATIEYCNEKKITYKPAKVRKILDQINYDKK